MAETDDDIAEWPLLCDALAFVTGYAKAEDAAKELILEYRAKGRIAYRWHQPDRPDGQLGQVPGSQWGHVAWGHPFHDDETGTHIVIDWHNSCATYIRVEPGSEQGAEMLARMKDHLPVSWVVRMPLIRLCRRDLITMLVEVGLMPSPSSQLEAPVAAKAAVTSAPSKLPRGKTERWVYDRMKAEPPEEGDRKYVANLHECCPYEVKQKTIANLVGKYRKRFELPAGTPGKVS